MDVLGRLLGPWVAAAGRRRQGVAGGGGGAGAVLATEVETEGWEGCELAEKRPALANTEVEYSCQRCTNSSYHTRSAEVEGATILTDLGVWWTPGNPGITARCDLEQVNQLLSSASAFTRDFSRFVNATNRAFRSVPPWLGKSMLWSTSHSKRRAMDISPYSKSTGFRKRCDRTQVSKPALVSTR